MTTIVLDSVMFYKTVSKWPLLYLTRKCFTGRFPNDHYCTWLGNVLQDGFQMTTILPDSVLQDGFQMTTIVLYSVMFYSTVSEWPLLYLTR